MISEKTCIENLLGKSFSAKAPAKLNLRLKIIGRRSDGYHMLSMLNVSTDFEDAIELCFQEQERCSIQTRGSPSDPGILDVDRNLATRAAQRLLEGIGSSLKVHIELKKNIPVGAGLGGGSSDAACVLKLLQSALHKVDIVIDDSTLAQIAISLGADVPYFLRGGLGRISGIGENVLSVASASLDNLSALLFLPAQSISTPAIYEEYRKRHPAIRQQDDAILNDVLSRTGGKDSGYQDLLGLVENDFELVLPYFCQPVWEALQLVRQQSGLVAGLTGSGSAFFALPRQLGADIHSLKAKIESTLAGHQIVTHVIALRTRPTY